jgi:hypothetical protein
VKIPANRDSERESQESPENTMEKDPKYPIKVFFDWKKNRIGGEVRKFGESSVEKRCVCGE